MAYSYVLYTGNGTTTNFAFPFPYLNQSDIKVRVNGVETGFTFLNSSTVTISPAPVAGAVVEVRRQTITTNAPVDFADGSVLLEKDLDLLAKYNLFSAQEAYDIGSDSLSQDTSGNLDAKNRRIVNLADPVNPADAVNKRTLQYEYPKVSTVADNMTDIKVVASDLGATVSYETDLGSITNPVTEDNLIGDSRITTVAENIIDIQTVADNIVTIQAADDNAAAAAASAASASTSASTATTQAGIATTKASEATASASSASSSASSATASASTATTKASEAATSASNAATSESIASTAATNAGASAISASSSATSATNSASSASTSASNASASASTATNAANTATTKASEASASASTASSAATTATTKATEATSAAADATASATLANDWATKTSSPVAGGEYSAKYHAQQAASSASSASSSASSASTSASAASAARTAAETARDQTLAAYDNFDDRYLGAKTSDPTLDNDGNALVAGALYFNSSLGYMKVYTGSVWVDAYAAGTSFLAKANNLSDLPNAATARTNLGLGTAATTNSTAYATAAQGSNADTAYSWGNHASAGYVSTSGTYSNPSWITALAYSKLTGAPSLATVATTGAYGDLTGKPTLGSLAAKNTVGTADIDNDSVTDAKLAPTLDLGSI